MHYWTEMMNISQAIIDHQPNNYKMDCLKWLRNNGTMHNFTISTILHHYHLTTTTLPILAPHRQHHHISATSPAHKHHKTSTTTCVHSHKAATGGYVHQGIICLIWPLYKQQHWAIVALQPLSRLYQSVGSPNFAQLLKWCKLMSAVQWS